VATHVFATPRVANNNQRTKKVAGANTTQYVTGLNGLIYGEYDAAGTLMRSIKEHFQRARILANDAGRVNGA
jgi:hypothetical protein